MNSTPTMLTATDCKLQLLEIYRQEEKARATLQMIGEKKVQLDQIIRQMEAQEKELSA